jgi:hypothetical protein
MATGLSAVLGRLGSRFATKPTITIVLVHASPGVNTKSSSVGCSTGPLATAEKYGIKADLPHPLYGPQASFLWFPACRGRGHPAKSLPASSARAPGASGEHCHNRAFAHDRVDRISIHCFAHQSEFEDIGVRRRLARSYRPHVYGCLYLQGRQSPSMDFRLPQFRPAFVPGGPYGSFARRIDGHLNSFQSATCPCGTCKEISP